MGKGGGGWTGRERKMRGRTKKWEKGGGDENEIRWRGRDREKNGIKCKVLISLITRKIPS